MMIGFGDTKLQGKRAACRVPDWQVERPPYTGDFFSTAGYVHVNLS
jgi:hypothetical protein